ncbi:DUF6193 family natural product biosynthesis protein [Phytomonospora sp. NPDC050363]|uniref:DUF6193 family natural product biosynthesis protein n=1 Tax=Phytomonospora sp. NPDC050363 TaxID=3155642 RepID=UPI00340BEC29
MTTLPEQSELYPDVLALGSLAAALQKVAVENGLELGDVEASQSMPLHWANVDSTTPRRDSLAIRAASERREWSVGGWGLGIELISGGWTEDLAAVAAVADAWRAGTPVVEIRRTWPFIKLNHRGEVAEQGPAAVVTAQWEWMRRQAEESGWPEHRALIEAAYAEPKLRQLYAYTSMWQLRFSTNVGWPFSPSPTAMLAPYEDGAYEVTWPTVPDAAEAATPEEAVALAVQQLPPNLSPAVEGDSPAPEDNAG